MGTSISFHLYQRRQCASQSQKFAITGGRLGKVTPGVCPLEMRRPSVMLQYGLAGGFPDSIAIRPLVLLEGIGPGWEDSQASLGGSWGSQVEIGRARTGIGSRV
jgi:hypothetical protein